MDSGFMGLRENGGGGGADWMCRRVEVTAVGRAGVEKPSGAKLEMPVVLGRFSGLERPKKKKKRNK